MKIWRSNEGVPAAAGTLSFLMEEYSAQLTFYIPSDLEASVPLAASRFPFLETLLARGDTTRSLYLGDAHLLALFGGDPSGGSSRAAVSHLAQFGAAGSEQWRIIASPVHLLADHATLHFPPQLQAALSDEASRALMESCQHHFAEEGWHLEYGDADTWYLQVSNSTGITTTPIDEAVGKPIFEVLPQGEDARTWRRWINEVQMLFHSHAVNDACSIKGEAPINSLWFWGEGRLPALSAGRFTHVYGGDSFVQGLAHMSGAQWSPLPDGTPFSEMRDNEGPLLFVLDNSAKLHWDSDWFAPLYSLLQRKTVTRAELHFRNGYTTHLRNSMLWRFWRRKYYSVAETGA